MNFSPRREMYVEVINHYGGEVSRNNKTIIIILDLADMQLLKRAGFAVNLSKL